MAAAEVWAEGAATVARIVERAGVGRSTFYEFFDSPEHLLEHLEQRALRGLESALEAALDGARTPLERVRAIARAWLAELDARPLEARVALTRRLDHQLIAPATNLLHRALERCVQAARHDGMGLTNADDVALLAATAAVEALSRRHLGGEPLREGARTLSDLIIKLLR